MSKYVLGCLSTDKDVEIQLGMSKYGLKCLSTSKNV